MYSGQTKWHNLLFCSNRQLKLVIAILYSGIFIRKKARQSPLFLKQFVISFVVKIAFPYHINIKDSVDRIV